MNEGREPINSIAHKGYIGNTMGIISDAQMKAQPQGLASRMAQPAPTGTAVVRATPTQAAPTGLANALSNSSQYGVVDDGMRNNMDRLRAYEQLMNRQSRPLPMGEIR